MAIVFQWSSIMVDHNFCLILCTWCDWVSHAPGHLLLMMTHTSWLLLIAVNYFGLTQSVLV